MKTALASLVAITIGWVGMFGFVQGSKTLLAQDYSFSLGSLDNLASPILYQAVDASGVGAQAGHYYIQDIAPVLPIIGARGYIVADLLSGDVLFEHNADKSYPIASVSKLTTATVALDEHMASTSMLYPLLLESSNEVANEIADSFGRERFIKFMNDFVSSLGMTQTHYRDPSGLSPKNVSSAHDLLRLATHIYHTHGDVLSITRLGNKDDWHNNNLFVQEHNPLYLGGKSGFTPEAGGTLVSLFDLQLSNGEARPVAIILLGTKSKLGIKYELAQELIDYLEKYVYFK